MYKDKEIIYVKALTPVHAGAGDGLESVDMPIQREKHSNIPKIEASSLKGSIKHALYNKIRIEYKSEIEYKTKREELYTIFGPEEKEIYSSSIGFTDVKMLFFPVKSATDIFKLVTCPYVIKRWIQDLKLIFKNDFKSLDENRLDIDVNSGEFLNNNEDKLILEEYIFEKGPGCIGKELLEVFESIKGLDVNRIVILNDTDFIDLVTMYTEIITRNKIDVETGAAKGNRLFTEEYLPSETIMYFLVLGAPSFNEKNENTSKQVLEYFNNNVEEVFQVGGDATIGKGFVQKLSFEISKDKAGDKNA